MPDLGLETHLRRLERVAVGDVDLDLVGAAGVGRVGRRGEHADEGAQGDAVSGGGKDARAVLVRLDVCELLGDAAVSASRHGWSRSLKGGTGVVAGGGSILSLGAASFGSLKREGVIRKGNLC